METELKFALSPDSREQIERRLGLDAAERTNGTHRYRTRYFDTPDLALRKSGFTLRVRHRQDSNRFTQTVKSGSGGSLQRDEWEWPVTGEQPELRHLAEVPGLPPALRSADLALAPVFETDVERMAKLVEAGDGTK